MSDASIKEERGGGGGGDDVVRTLFISGLPQDVQERELFNLFRPCDGYESSQLQVTSRSVHPVGFATFVDQPSALSARDALNGVIFDPAAGLKLRIELAKANSKPKRARTEDGGVNGTADKKFRGSVGLAPMSNPLMDPFAPYSGPGGGGTPGMVHSYFNNLGGTMYQPPSAVMGGSYGGPEPIGIGSASGVMSSGGKLGGSNPPCTTLFVANLGPTCNELELRDLFSSCPGFVKLRIQMKRGAPVAFAEFQDIHSSTMAINQLQNYMLPSCDRGGVRLEYAKSRMGLPSRHQSNDSGDRSN
ncbi:hypothetical protein CBR_g48442 [Chara braunii]|uniref:RRM domain-containing protein n=1 Tax=Chara braunii TaxID=69332 RepID=A0A388M2L7_CHABU|nr:hypothetical protein CBR_g48442 [Chara braunii]|eukprot:GBG88828.1 hypothetical protein CBR_g48442 [Chara braunii]